MPFDNNFVKSMYQEGIEFLLWLIFKSLPQMKFTQCYRCCTRGGGIKCDTFPSLISPLKIMSSTTNSSTNMSTNTKKATFNRITATKDFLEKNSKSQDKREGTITMLGGKKLQPYLTPKPREEPAAWTKRSDN